MFCSKCGCQIGKDAKFCYNCGEKVVVEKSPEVKTILLRCKLCNGELSISENQQIICCPYCGSKEMIVESDIVKTAQINADAYRDVEYGKQQTAIKMKQMDIDEKNREDSKFVHSKLIGLILIIGSLGLFLFSVEYHSIFNSSMLMFITLLCIILLITGFYMVFKRKVKKK